MNKQSVVAAPPKRTAKTKALSRAQLSKELEGTGVTTSKSESKEQIAAKLDELRKAPARVTDSPKEGEY